MRLWVQDILDDAGVNELTSLILQPQKQPMHKDTILMQPDARFCRASLLRERSAWQVLSHTIRF
jgi:hypothetical protein